MSLILDALKRSEGERQEKAGAITLGSYSPQPRPRSKWLWIVIGALLLVNALVVAWLAMSRQSASPEPAAVPVAKTRPAVPARAPQPASPAATPAASSRLGMRRPGPMSRPAPKPRPESSRPPASPPAGAPPLPKRRLAAETLHPARKKPEHPAVSAPTTQPVAAPAVATAPEKPRAPAPVVVSPTDTGETAPGLEEAPDDIRAKLAAFEINAHVYSDEPEKRFTLINMQRYGEGDTLPGSNFRIEKILPTGVLIDYGRGRVLMPLNRY